MREGAALAVELHDCQTTSGEQAGDWFRGDWFLYDILPGWPAKRRPTVTIADKSGPPGTLPRLPPRDPPRLPGEHLLRRRTPTPYACATSSHPGDLLVCRGTF